MIRRFRYFFIFSLQIYILFLTPRLSFCSEELTGYVNQGTKADVYILFDGNLRKVEHQIMNVLGKKDLAIITMYQGWQFVPGKTQREDLYSLEKELKFWGVQAVLFEQTCENCPEGNPVIRADKEFFSMPTIKKVSN